MRIRRHLVASLVLTLGCLPVTRAQSSSNTTLSRRTPSGLQSLEDSESLDQIINRIIARERVELSMLGSYHPIIESYLQTMMVHHGERVRHRDWYLLGQAVMSDDQKLAVRAIAFNWGRSRTWSWYMWDDNAPDDVTLLDEANVGRFYFDRQHYDFQYAGQEFLGEVRCLEFDVKPLYKNKIHLFTGRIWVEDHDYTIVRFSGQFGGLDEHFDSWRVNVQPGLWVPAYIFTQALSIKGWPHTLKVKGGFDAQTRFWGYDLRDVQHQDAFSELTIESQNELQGSSASSDQSPLEQQREWRSEAERNALDTLQKMGFITAPGPVDRMLETVVNNLEVSNNLDIEPEIHCRVMTTSDLELFSIGHTIVLSRGLIDVLPDEATLATMLAQGMARIVRSNETPDKYGFGDVLGTSIFNATKRFASKESPTEERAANELALTYLRKSPYNAGLGEAGLFLEQLRSDSKSLVELTAFPHFGNSVFLASDLMTGAPALEPKRLDQIAALPLGGRIDLNPWSDEAVLVKPSPLRLVSPHEKMPFGVTPFMPYLTRYKDAKTASIPDKNALSGAAAPSSPN